MRKQITLVCAVGMSTSLLVTKMKTAAKERGVDVEIVAVAESAFEGQGLEKVTDVLLLGPQVCFMAKKLKARYEPSGIKVEVINSRDYGMLNGDKVLSDALALMGE